MNLHRLIAIPLALWLAVLPGPASAEGMPAGLTRAEKAAFALVETLFTAAAVAVERRGCDEMQGYYLTELTTYWDGTGSARVDHLRLDIQEVASSTKGNLFEVTSAAPTGDINYLQLEDLSAGYGFDYGGGMFYGDASLLAEDLPYRTPMIKDIWVELQPGAALPKNPVISMEGFQAVTKFDYPRSKWSQSAHYQRPGAEDGSLFFTSNRIAPYGASVCSITYTALADNLGRGLQTFGGLLRISN